MLASDVEKYAMASDALEKTVASDHEETKASAEEETIASDELEKTLANAEEKKLICFDANNWLDTSFWDGDADMERITDPWKGLWFSDRRVGEFVKAAWSSNFKLVVVISGGASGRDARETYRERREKEIVNEKKRVCLGADLFLQESFERHGARVVRPIDADVNDVLASIADWGGKFKGGAVIVSRNRCFFDYDRPLSVCQGFKVRGSKLILHHAMTANEVSRQARNTVTVQPHLGQIAMGDERKWSQQDHATFYRPSLRQEARVERGTSSSSDKRMGNLHLLARPLRAAVYASLDEHSALERIPEWNEDEKTVVWTEIEVVADTSLSDLLKNPVATLNWILEADKASENLEPWRQAERMFNTCALAAELVTVSFHAPCTMLKCM